jgi:hypothetical protein
MASSFHNADELRQLQHEVDLKVGLINLVTAFEKGQQSLLFATPVSER